MRRNIITVSAVLFFAIVAFAFSRGGPSNDPRPTISVRFLGNTNTAAGECFARFEFSSNLPMRVSIGSPCTLSTGTRISFHHQSVGSREALVIELPATNFLAQSWPVRFDFMRGLTSQEKLISKAYDLSEFMGIKVSKLRFRSMTNRMFGILCQSQIEDPEDDL